MSEPRHEFTTLESSVPYSGAILALRLDQVAMPNGRKAEREVIEHHGAVGILAVDDQDRVAMIEQYRHPVGRRLWELPAGLLDAPGEPPVLAAQRELAEETGLAAGTWSVLVDVLASPGFTDEAVRIFLAQDLTQVDRPEAHDEEADIELSFVPMDEAVRRALSGEIVNASAVAGVLAFAAARAAGTELRPADAPWPDLPTAFEKRKSSRK
ncbi:MULTISPECIES: NUDIX hydrolase [unclassified Rhodococcus (in: high G+C Gram-positive bacteria)]|uniref:NUDIX domain-containing protein n=1 Tax=unclassified Rhodococcus (in: high G+C Gram-positive bacteria) TaxID=192944 RepID=UPI000B9A33D6|nr:MULTISPECIES: NUDIX hydrolase [unclassified Rhodococcus (in: high G+C Gram-positive bacteria)]OZE31232.1 ADP-ribose pyrophosphatase [Rhodococcus sp. 05-2254-4]OZE41857.1 ADP-ribose pyrophosphatase [Rhodococcus sp. 05-2254-3]OZE43663.1 ADP-ribose pyrophosphatase [Rhodococcus sp. 05-2254-6]OZE52292.1 ADP-ribose pyrophosphatase [Rhodococcus sp. 05-2254-2]